MSLVGRWRLTQDMHSSHGVGIKAGLVIHIDRCQYELNEDLAYIWFTVESNDHREPNLNSVGLDHGWKPIRYECMVKPSLLEKQCVRIYDHEVCNLATQTRDRNILDERVDMLVKGIWRNPCDIVAMHALADYLEETDDHEWAKRWKNMIEAIQQG